MAKVLNVKEIREQYAPNKLFPHEIIFRKMLNDVKAARRSKMNSERLTDHSIGSLFQWQKENLPKPQNEEEKAEAEKRR